MARMIDADRLADGLKLHRQPTDQKHEADRQWAVGYNAGLDRALHSIAYAPTLTQPNEPLPLEQLREMDVEKVWRGCPECKPRCGLCAHIFERDKYGKPDVCESCVDFSNFESDQQFCEVCGSPMTDKAVDMVMERLEKLKNEIG